MDEEMYPKRTIEANEMIDRVVHQITLRDFHSSFLHHAHFRLPNYNGGVELKE